MKCYGVLLLFPVFESRHHYTSASENDDITDPHQNYNTVPKFNEETVYLKKLIQYIKYLLHYKYTMEREHRN